MLHEEGGLAAGKLRIDNLPDDTRKDGFQSSFRLVVPLLDYADGSLFKVDEPADLI